MTDTLLEFPCDFPIKAMGPASDAFQAEVVAIMRRHVADFTEDAVVVRESREGRYRAITVTIRATSREQLDAIYHELTASDQVVMAL